MVLRKVIMQDLDQIIALENIGFSPEEAATPEALKLRIVQIQETFIVAEKNDEVIGYINGPVIKERYISDDLFKNVPANNSEGGYISVLGLVVAPNYQGQGIAGRLLNYFENLAKNQHRHGVTLTCRESLISFYEKYEEMEFRRLFTISEFRLGELFLHVNAVMNGEEEFLNSPEQVKTYKSLKVYVLGKRGIPALSEKEKDVYMKYYKLL